MQKSARWLLIAAVFAVAVAQPLDAQGAGHGFTKLVSANPFGLLLNLFNAEFEAAITESSTLGVGGSADWADTDVNDDGVDEPYTYVNADVFWRYYPSGSYFEGWNFGVKVGFTRQEGTDEDWFSGVLTEYETANFGYGFDLNRSWLLGKNNNFYVGAGFGLKRLVGDIPDGASKYIPTFRIVNVGFAF